MVKMSIPVSAARSHNRLFRLVVCGAGARVYEGKVCSSTLLMVAETKLLGEDVIELQVPRLQPATVHPLDGSRVCLGVRTFGQLSSG